ncbi:hypothetical protein PCANC_13777 [Puccinia coronata f. sp. avenae]|uniref:Uncharacterized protein n=1 Tax=Puccinia coronata f. sp. avenae TaxID=200324 RepID=A0A2N5V293_9BASI|nr:hypothetical protein PCANC_13777 [Puccinia coronata f. sp. avenae]
MSRPPNLDSSPGTYNYPSGAYNIAGNLPPLDYNLDVYPLPADPGYEPLVNRFLDEDHPPYARAAPINPLTLRSSLPNKPIDESRPGLLPNPQTSHPDTRQSSRFQPYPSTAPPQLPETTPSLTSKGLARTRKPNRTPEQIQAAEAALALKQQEHANKVATKAADTRIKAAQKAARNVVKAKDKAAAACRLKWTLNASCELLKFIRIVKEEHNQREARGFGFLAVGKFFDTYTERREEFPLLDGIDNDALLRQYHAILGTYKQVKDQIDQLGSGGLLDALVRFAMPHELEMLQPMPLERTRWNDNLLAPLPTVPTGSYEDSDRKDNIGADVPTVSPPPATPHRRRQQTTADLTDAERALDEDTPPPSQDVDADFTYPSHIGDKDNSEAILPPRPPASTKPLLTRTQTEPGARTPIESAAATNAKQGKSWPSAVGGNLPRRSGKTKEAPKKNNQTGDSMLLFMQTSQQQARQWLLDKRKQSDDLRAEEQRDSDARAKAKDQARLDQLAQAKLDKQDFLDQARQDTEALKAARAQEHAEDNCWYEASQERIATAQAMMMSVLA